MSTITLPHTIQNKFGEKLVFLRTATEQGEETVYVENFVDPGCGPAMHVHFKQAEYLEVKRGKMGYQILGQAPVYLEAGEGILFERGVPHRFWNAGEETLNCTGWIRPANSVVYFLDALYGAVNKNPSGQPQPEAFDGAYLMTRYRSEYDVYGIPAFVKKVIMPVTCFIGKLAGKYKHFADAPQPLP